MKLMILKVCAVIAFVLNLRATTCDGSCDIMLGLDNKKAKLLFAHLIDRNPEYAQEFLTPANYKSLVESGHEKYLKQQVLKQVCKNKLRWYSQQSKSYESCEDMLKLDDGRANYLLISFVAKRPQYA